MSDAVDVNAASERGEVALGADRCGYLNATTQGVKQAFKKLEAKRRRQGLKVVARS